MIVILTIFYVMGTMSAYDWKEYGHSNLASSSVSRIWMVGNSLIPYTINTTGIVVDRTGNFVIGFLSAIAQPLDSLLKYVLWLIFFIGVTIFLLYLLGVIDNIPELNFRTQDGSVLSVENKSYDEMSIWEKTVDFISSTIQQTKGEFSTSIGIEANIPKKGEYTKREDISEGRCDDIEYITEGNQCTWNKRMKNINWKYGGESEDYSKLPEEFKQRNLENITIPYKEISGFYYPDCDNSYYTDIGITKGKTNILKNISNNKCVYIDGDMKKYP